MLISVVSVFGIFSAKKNKTIKIPEICLFLIPILGNNAMWSHPQTGPKNIRNCKKNVYASLIQNMVEKQTSGFLYHSFIICQGKGIKK